MKSPVKNGLVFLALVTAAAAASAVPTVYVTTLSGLNEEPQNSSPATGTARVTVDPDLHQLTVTTSFSGLVGTTTAAHIHCCTPTPNTGTAGVATQTPTFEGFPAGVTSGDYSRLFDTTQASTWNGTFITNNGGTTAGAESALWSGLAEGRAYLNIHSSVYPNGEIRGFLQPIPEPGQWAMLLMGIPAVLALRRRRG